MSSRDTARPSFGILVHHNYYACAARIKEAAGFYSGSVTKNTISRRCEFVVGDKLSRVVAFGNMRERINA